MSHSKTTLSVPPIMRPTSFKGWLFFLLVMAVTFVLGLMVSSVLERRREAVQLPQVLTPVDQLDGDNSKWGVLVGK